MFSSHYKNLFPFFDPVYCLNHLQITQKLVDGEPDWSIVSRAWWDAVNLIEKSAANGVFAVDMALELRIMGGSEVWLKSW